MLPSPWELDWWSPTSVLGDPPGNAPDGLSLRRCPTLEDFHQRFTLLLTSSGSPCPADANHPRLQSTFVDADPRMLWPFWTSFFEWCVTSPVIAPSGKLWVGPLAVLVYSLSTSGRKSLGFIPFQFACTQMIHILPSICTSDRRSRSVHANENVNALKGS